jgi:hypothetical protein
VKTALKFVVARLSEASTIRGGLYLLMAAGLTLRPEVSDAIVTFGLGLAGLFGVLLPDTAQ